ncbi:MAG: hypothetical protein ACRD2Y_01580 [Terriglobales bacterium]
MKIAKIPHAVREGRVAAAWVQGLLSFVPWNVRRGFSSFLTMEFGEERLEEHRGKTYVHGEWHLWLQHCAWRIQEGGRIVTTSEEKDAIIDRALRRLKFGPVVEANVASSTLDLFLKFESDIRLLTFTSHKYGYDQWDLFRPDGQVLTAHAGGVLIEEAADGRPFQSDQSI